KKFADPDYSGPIKNTAQSTSAFIKAANTGKIAVSPADVQRLLDIYDSQIIVADKFVASIVETLKKLNLEDKTMLIVTADHGEQFYEYKHFGHVSKFNPFADTSTRVPLIIYCPLLPHRGKVERLVEIIDLVPTIFEAAGFKEPNHCQGESLYPLLCGKPSFFLKKKKEIYYCNLYFLGIRTEKLKLILDLGTGETKLFDLVKDPAEKYNLIQEYSTEVVKSLVDKVRRFQEETENLRKKLNISQVKLLEGLPSRPLAFDDHTLLLASFSHGDFYFKKRNSVKRTKFEAPELQLVEGKYGGGLLLQGDKKISFPLKTPLLGQIGSLEFWLKINQVETQNQRVLKLYFKGKDSSLSIEATAFWSWMEEGKIGISFKLTKLMGKRSESELSLTKKILWDGWHHILLAWEENEVFLVIDGHSSSRRKILAGDIFKQATTNSIIISGQNCVIDDFRISNNFRLFRPSGRKKVRIEPKVLEKLKALGYIK
ncbi:MAG: sulfatase-like hydrolase/transferase, partial [Candidatus Aminicenantales bacterium]